MPTFRFNPLTIIPAVARTVLTARKIRRRPNPLSGGCQPHITEINADTIAELRALARDEPHWMSIARQIVTQPEIAAKQTMLERQMAWHLLREHRRAAAAPVTAA